MKRQALVGALALALSVGCSITSFAGWQSNKQGYWYETHNGDYYKDCWKSIEGKYYHFDKDGYMNTGWYQDNDGTWYYMGLSGDMQKGWQFVNGQWYYLRTDNGAMLQGWQKINNKWYFLNSDGSMRTGWFNDNGTWYLLDTDGKMLTGWQKVGNDWYYLNESGAMLTGQQLLDGGYYLLDASGRWVSSADNKDLLGPSSGVEYTETLEANMSTPKIRGLANYYYDKYYNDINSAFAYLNDLRDDGHKLNYSEALCKAAICHSIDMISFNYFGNDNKNTSDVTEWQHWARLNDTNIDGESIVFDTTIQNCFESLKRKDADLKNLKNTAYTTAGVGIAVKPDGNIYLTIMLQK